MGWLCILLFPKVFFWFDWHVLLCLVLVSNYSQRLEESVWFSSLQTYQCGDSCIPASSPYLSVIWNLHMQLSLAIWEILSLLYVLNICPLFFFFFKINLHIWSVPIKGLRLALWWSRRWRFYWFLPMHLPACTVETSRMLASRYAEWVFGALSVTNCTSTNRWQED